MSSTVSTTVPSRSNTTGSNPGCGRGSDTEPLQVELPGGELGEQFGVQQVVAQRRDRHADAADTDFDVVGRGCVAVTPLRYDLLDPELLAELASWEFDLERLRV